MSADLALGVATSAAAAVFLSAGLGKLAVPRPASRAIEEFLSDRRRPSALAVARTVGVVEVLTALTLIIPAFRPLGAWLAGLLGLGFVFLGTVARIRHSTVACGCFGRGSGRPFGLRNAASGLGLLAVGLADAWVPYGSHPTNPALPLVLTGAFCICLGAWLHRKLIVTLLRYPTQPSNAQGAET